MSGDFRRRLPGRTQAFELDRGAPVPGHAGLADADRIADRAAVAEHVIELARVGEDHDRAGRDSRR